jgi:cytoskeletal protein RodZ
LKELGENLRLARNNIGISIDEVANDLGIDKVLLDNLENGNAKAFKDIVSLKETIISYAKYLGLDQETLLDDFNDFVFSSTSKISTEDIKEATKKTKEKEKDTKKIKSPYTIEKKSHSGTITLIVSGILMVMILAILYFVIRTRMFG